MNRSSCGCEIAMIGSITQSRACAFVSCVNADFGRDDASGCFRRTLVLTMYKLHFQSCVNADFGRNNVSRVACELR